jgi:hypothetical protein
MYEDLAKMAERIGWQSHDEAPDPQEDNSDGVGESIAEAIRAAAPKWTTTPPKEDGVYWAITKRGNGPYCVDVDLRTGEVWHHGFSGDVSESISYYSHWLGPLPVPEPPKVDA